MICEGLIKVNPFFVLYFVKTYIISILWRTKLNFMKKILLSLLVVSAAFVATSQVIVSGISPASIQGSYAYGVQAACGAWPGETDDGTWGVQPVIDFNVPGTIIQAELMLVNDGSTGLNAQGNPVSGEGCAGFVDAGPPPVNVPATGVYNDLTGKIAVIFRNTCSFSYKILQAQNAGALAVIIVNREDADLSMLAAADGVNVTIPAVILQNTPGMLLVNEMANGPVEMLIGNKIGAFVNDIGSFPSDILIAPKAGAHSATFNGFNLAMQMYNWGSAVQNAITVTAEITDPSAATVYSSVVNVPAMNSGDTTYIVNGNPVSFPKFELPSYAIGTYTLTYTLDMGVTDESDFDNVFTSSFTINNDVISLASIDGSNLPTSTTYPSNSETEYQSCMFYVDSNASKLTLEGIYFVPYSDSLAEYPIAGEPFFVNLYEWNDTWVDLADPNFPDGNSFFATLTSNQIDYIEYYPASDAENGTAVYAPLTNEIQLVDNQRYLVCLQSFNPKMAFGYDGTLNYDGNQGITAMPISPVYVDGTWYTAGWNGSSAASIGLKARENFAGLNEITEVSGKAFPNPANDVVTISTEATGNATISVTDVTGKVVLNNSLSLPNGTADMNIDSLESGMYIFTVAFEGGETSTFNVVKK
mgnify:CR=1 FL=1